jgi:hypothetical protein
MPHVLEVFDRSELEVPRGIALDFTRWSKM